MLFIVLIGFTIVKKKTVSLFWKWMQGTAGLSHTDLPQRKCPVPALCRFWLRPGAPGVLADMWIMKAPPTRPRWEAVSWLMDPGHKLPTVHSGKINSAFVAYYAGWLHTDTWKHDTEENEKPSKLPLPLKMACQSCAVAGRQLTILLIRYIWGWVHWHGLWDWAPREPAVLKRQWVAPSLRLHISSDSCLASKALMKPIIANEAPHLPTPTMCH